MIGDTEADILAGKKAKVMTIGVSYGFHGSHIAGSKPDYIIDDIADIIPILLSERNFSGTQYMPPAAAREKERSELGAPQTPAGGLRPPAPPAE